MTEVATKLVRQFKSKTHKPCSSARTSANRYAAQTFSRVVQTEAFELPVIESAHSNRRNETGYKPLSCLLAGSRLSEFFVVQIMRSKMIDIKRWSKAYNFRDCRSNLVVERLEQIFEEKRNELTRTTQREATMSQSNEHLVNTYLISKESASRDFEENYDANRNVTG